MAIVMIDVSGSPSWGRYDCAQHAKPIKIMMVGLHGSGKTTSTAKLSRLLKKRGYRPFVVACDDLHRPAAIDQIEILARQEEVGFFSDRESKDVPAIGKAGLAAGLAAGADAIIFDTAGRLQIDEVLIDEVKRLGAVVSPEHELNQVGRRTTKPFPVLLRGAAAEPIATAASTMPLARPCLEGLIHLATPCAAAGKVGASPTPSTKRRISRSVSILTVALPKGPQPSSAMNTVITTHEAAAQARTRRAPQRSAAAPDGI